MQADLQAYAGRLTGIGRLTYRQTYRHMQAILQVYIYAGRLTGICRQSYRLCRQTYRHMQAEAGSLTGYAGRLTGICRQKQAVLQEYAGKSTIGICRQTRLTGICRQ